MKVNLYQKNISNGVKYYVNGVPPEIEEIWKHAREGQEWEFAKRKINILIRHELGLPTMSNKK